MKRRVHIQCREKEPLKRKKSWNLALNVLLFPPRRHLKERSAFLLADRKGRKPLPFFRQGERNGAVLHPRGNGARAVISSSLVTSGDSLSTLKESKKLHSPSGEKEEEKGPGKKGLISNVQWGGKKSSPLQEGRERY